MPTRLSVMLSNNVNGRIHTNGLENFWSLLKLGISGTYISVAPFHWFRYLDEQSFRYNNRIVLGCRPFGLLCLRSLASVKGGVKVCNLRRTDGKEAGAVCQTE